MSIRTECPYEQYLKQLGFIQIYDGESAPQRPDDPTSLKPGERSFFIRHYQLVRNNRMTNEYAKLVYDLRGESPRLRYFPEHYRKLANGAKKVEDMLAIRTVRT